MKALALDAAVQLLKCFLTCILVSLILSPSVMADAGNSTEFINFKDCLGKAGFNLTHQNFSGVEIVFSVPAMKISEIDANGISRKLISIPGVILPKDEGSPNLPGMGRYIAIPEGAAAEVELLDYRTVKYQDIDLAPAPPIRLVTDETPLSFEENPKIYNVDAYYPESPVVISDPIQIRGVDAVLLGITPFQYNPVTKELVVYQDLRIRVEFMGGNGRFGEDRLRSRYWESILRGNLLNYSSLPKVNFNRIPQTDEADVEYLIIVPDIPEFIAWADTIKQWRNQQGVITGITTLTEIGGNDPGLIEDYINEAYHTWDPAPAAVLLMADYQEAGVPTGITAPRNLSAFNCISDNFYADIDEDDLPDIAFARMTARNEQHLATMVGKLLEYERTPPIDPDFFQHPISAGSWETDQWFILGTEVIWGFLNNELGKDPVREYTTSFGTPGNIWSTNPNTWMIVDYFGPTGLGYIPNDPSHLTDWGANAERITRDINEGAFIAYHSDHGDVDGWVHPDFTNSDLPNLENDDYPFFWSMNCLNGKFDDNDVCFAEAIHRMEHGALGIIASSQISWNTVNVTMLWGMMDGLWPQFIPDYGTDPFGSIDLRTCFSLVYGKYFLEASNWPNTPQYKTDEYYLFHHHGDAFTTLYSEIPQNLTVVHQDVLLSGLNQFAVTANAGAMIALTVNNELIGIAEATGAPVNIPIAPQIPGNNLLITVTLQNHYRYMQEIPIIPPSGPYVIATECEVVDNAGWNPNDQLDYDENVKLTLTIENVGNELAPYVTVTITTEDSLLTIIDNMHYYGDIPAGEVSVVAEGFEITASPQTPDEHIFIIDAIITSDTLWESSFVINGHAPEFSFNRMEFDDPTGNDNGWLDPGETADMELFLSNDGSSPGILITGNLTSPDPLLVINSSTGDYGTVNPGDTASAVFNLTADPGTPQEYIADANIALSGDHSYNTDIVFEILVGNVLYDPTGPDNYGYSAYDPYDPPEFPEYDWVEICADSGGPGTLVPFTQDEQVFQYILPFTFQYYGVDYDTFTVAANGWIAMGRVGVDDYSNSVIPNSDGPPAMIAPYWEDMSPQRPNSGGVWQWYDESNHLFVLEFNHVEQFSPTGNFETFQTIIYDPVHHPTATGDGRILFQYKDMSNSAQSEGTIGIENHLQNDGIEYLYDGDYNTNAHAIYNEMAVLYSTLLTAPSLAVILEPVNPPIIIPPGGGTFGCNLSIENTGVNPAVFDGWIEVVLPNGSIYGPIVLRNGISLYPAATIIRELTQNVPGNAPAGDYLYRCNAGMYPLTVYHSDEFGFSKTGMDANYNGMGWVLTGWDEEGFAPAESVPDEYQLAQNYPNPFNPLTTIAYALPKASDVRLAVYDILGRETVSLVNGWQSAGYKSVQLDASNLSSGIYFYRLLAGDFTEMKKMVLVK